MENYEEAIAILQGIRETLAVGVLILAAMAVMQFVYVMVAIFRRKDK